MYIGKQTSNSAGIHDRKTDSIIHSKLLLHCFDATLRIFETKWITMLSTAKLITSDGTNNFDLANIYHSYLNSLQAYTIKGQGRTLMCTNIMTQHIDHSYTSFTSIDAFSGFHRMHIEDNIGIQVQIYNVKQK